MTDGINGAYIDSTREAFRGRTGKKTGTWYPVSYGGWEFVPDRKRKTKRKKR